MLCAFNRCRAADVLNIILNPTESSWTTKYDSLKCHCHFHFKRHGRLMFIWNYSSRVFLPLFFICCSSEFCGLWQLGPRLGERTPLPRKNRCQTNKMLCHSEPTFLRRGWCLLAAVITEPTVIPELFSVCLFLIRRSSEFRGLIKLAPSFKREAARDPGELIGGALEMIPWRPAAPAVISYLASTQWIQF